MTEMKIICNLTGASEISNDIPVSFKSGTQNPGHIGVILQQQIGKF
jgi:hypothetical protein